MTEETNKVVAAVAAPENKTRIIREPIFKTGFSFTNANMAFGVEPKDINQDFVEKAARIVEFT